MFNKEIPNEYSKRINEVVNFILANLAEDLSLQSLAKIAGYSSFHFQRVFKQVMGESPKQYIIRMRLETAAHALIVHPDKSITEIALDNGFSSSPTFARAFKNYFNISSEQFRNLRRKNSADIIQKITHSKAFETRPLPKVIVLNRSAFDAGSVVVKRSAGWKGIFANARLDDSKSIQAAFKKTSQLAETHDLLTAESKFIGVIYLHHNLYRALVTINPKKEIPAHIDSMEIPAGKFATLTGKGSALKTFETIVAFSEFWLPESGYRIADIYYFEILSENPLNQSYDLIEKEIFSPIKPV